MKKILVALFTVLLLVSAFSTVKNPDTLVSLVVGEPNTLDPHRAYDLSSAAVIYNVYDTLLDYKGSSLSEFVPRIAEEVPTVENGLITDGGKTYKFKIRKGVKFHSGNELTPYDVKYSFIRGLIGNPGGGPIWMYYEVLFGDYFSLKSAVKGLTGHEWSELVDPATKEPVNEEAKQILIDFFKKYIDTKIEVDGDYVIFHLAQPKGYFLNVISGVSWGAILDSKMAKEIGLWDGKVDGWWKFHDWKKEDSPLHTREIGSGPYYLENWDKASQKVTLRAFDNYWAGPAKLKKVVIWTVTEWSTRKMMLERGDADVIVAPPDILPQLKQNKDIQVIEGIPRATVNLYVFNWSLDSDSPYIGSGKLDEKGIPLNFFADKNVRLGFIRATDFNTLIKDIVNGYGIVVPAILPKGFLGYDDSLPKPKFDLAEATKYFKRAFRGQLWRKGFKMTLIYNNGNQTRQKTSEMLAQTLKQINPKFNVDTRGVQWPSFLDARKNGKMPIIMTGWVADYPDPNNFIYTFYDSNGNYGRYQGKKFAEFASRPQAFFGGKSLNEMIEEATKETDPKKRQEIYVKVQQFAIREGLGTPLFQTIGYRIQRSWVKGWVPNPIRPGDNYYVMWKSDE